MRSRNAINVLAACWPSVGVLFAFLGFIWGLRPSTGFSFGYYVWIALVALLTLVAALQDIRRIARHRSFSFNNAKAIDDYMRDWIKSDGRVAISSHDLSWVSRDSENLNRLIEKARQSELTLFLPNVTDLSERLRAAGAEVITYDDLHYVPESRFTIVGFGRVGAKVAVGRVGTNTREWIIEEFQSGSDPAFHLAGDFIQVLRRHADARE